MAEFEEKLNSILGNQEAMGQIMALARSLSGGGQPQEPEEPSAPDPPDSMSEHREEQNMATPPMPDLSALLGQIDPGMIQLGMRIFQEYQGSDDRSAALLAALRPFLKEDRRAKLDRALQIARVTRLIRVALGAMEGRGRKGVYNRYIPEDASYSRVEPEPFAPLNEGGTGPREYSSNGAGRANGGVGTQKSSRGGPKPGQQPFGLGGFKLPPFFLGKDGLEKLFSGKERGGLAGLLKSLHLENIDTGDILLLLIVLYLLVEGDDLELVIALGLVLIMALGDDAGENKT